MVESRAPDCPTPLQGPRLVGDIGGTNARLGWQAHAGAPIESVLTLPCAAHASLEAAIRAYLTQTGQPMPVAASLGMANPVTGDAVAMTNHHWRFSVEGLRASLGLSRLLVLNDFTALALALPTLKADVLRPVGHGVAQERAPKALLGAGTGLGVSGLLPRPQGGWTPLAGEGGHVSLAAQTTEEFAVVQHLQAQHGHVSAERVLSGAGLLALYHALAQVQGQTSAPLVHAADVLQGAQDDPQGLAGQTLAMFCGFLGSVAGDLALILGAQGGVYIGGGIVPRLGARFALSPFRARFEAKGRFRAYLQSIPVWVIDSPQSPALEGAAQALDGPS
jgi:glucokinase